MKNNECSKHINNEIICRSCISEFVENESMIVDCSSTNIVQKLSELPNVKAKPGFEKKMMALFALELENEIHTRNSQWLKHKKSIKLPELIDLRKEFL